MGRVRYRGLKEGGEDDAPFSVSIGIYRNPGLGPCPFPKCTLLKGHEGEHSLPDGQEDGSAGKGPVPK